MLPKTLSTLAKETVSKKNGLCPQRSSACLIASSDLFLALLHLRLQFDALGITLPLDHRYP